MRGRRRPDTPAPAAAARGAFPRSGTFRRAVPPPCSLHVAPSLLARRPPTPCTLPLPSPPAELPHPSAPARPAGAAVTKPSAHANHPPPLPPAATVAAAPTAYPHHRYPSPTAAAGEHGRRGRGAVARRGTGRPRSSVGRRESGRSGGSTPDLRHHPVPPPQRATSATTPLRPARVHAPAAHPSESAHPPHLTAGGGGWQRRPSSTSTLAAGGAPATTPRQTGGRQPPQRQAAARHYCFARLTPAGRAGGGTLPCIPAADQAQLPPYTPVLPALSRHAPFGRLAGGVGGRCRFIPLSWDRVDGRQARRCRRHGRTHGVVSHPRRDSRCRGPACLWGRRGGGGRAAPPHRRSSPPYRAGPAGRVCMTQPGAGARKGRASGKVPLARPVSFCLPPPPSSMRGPCGACPRVHARDPAAIRSCVPPRQWGDETTAARATAPPPPPPPSHVPLPPRPATAGLSPPPLLAAELPVARLRRPLKPPLRMQAAPPPPPRVWMHNEDVPARLVGRGCAVLGRLGVLHSAPHRRWVLSRAGWGRGKVGGLQAGRGGRGDGGGGGQRLCVPAMSACRTVRR